MANVPSRTAPSIDLQKEKITQIVSVFETGKSTPQYDVITILPDGPDKIFQITYGKHQGTEFGGSLKGILQRYIAANGKESPILKKYVDTIGQKPSKWTNKLLIDSLKRAGVEPIMAKIQDDYFNLNYMTPSEKFFNENGFKLPLSLLVIYDSYIHSGGIFAFLRNRFSEMPPNKGGDEKKWITAYVNARDEWLENHSDAILRNTDYRTDSFIYAIKNNNWLLDKPFKVVNYKDNDELSKPIIRAIIK